MDEHDERFEAALRQVRATGSIGLSPRWAVLQDLIDEGDALKLDLIRRAGGYLEVELAADWLGMDVAELRRHAEAGDLIAVEWGGRLVIPAFQIRNAVTVLQVREILAVMPIRAAWMRLEWFLTPDETLDGLAPLKALQRGREAEVRDLARSHGAD